MVLLWQDIDDLPSEEVPIFRFFWFKKKRGVYLVDGYLALFFGLGLWGCIVLSCFIVFLMFVGNYSYSFSPFLFFLLIF